MARSRTDDLNAWPAFTDTMLAFVLVLVLMITYQVAQFIDTAPEQEGVQERKEDQSRVTELIEEFEQQGYNIQVSTNGVNQRLRFGSDVTFKSGNAILSGQGKRLLNTLAQEITGRRGAEKIRTLTEIQVAGHTDDVPINNQKFQSNWELSTVRATRVLESLIGEGVDREGVDPSKVAMSATGYGQYQPRASNQTDSGRRKNRRIEVRLIYSNKISDSKG